MPSLHLTFPLMGLLRVELCIKTGLKSTKNSSFPDPSSTDKNKVATEFPSQGLTNAQSIHQIPASTTTIMNNSTLESRSSGPLFITKASPWHIEILLLKIALTRHVVTAVTRDTHEPPLYSRPNV